MKKGAKEGEEEADEKADTPRASVSNVIFCV